MVLCWGDRHDWVTGLNRLAVGPEGNRGEGALLQRIRAHWKQAEGSDFARVWDGYPWL